MSRGIALGTRAASAASGSRVRIGAAFAKTSFCADRVASDENNARLERGIQTAGWLAPGRPKQRICRAIVDTMMAHARNMSNTRRKLNVPNCTARTHRPGAAVENSDKQRRSTSRKPRADQSPKVTTITPPVRHHPHLPALGSPPHRTPRHHLRASSKHTQTHRLLAYLSAGVARTIEEDDPDAAVPAPPTPPPPLPGEGDVISDSNSSARSTSVGRSMMDGMATTTPMSLRRAAESFASSREWPPRSKKSEDGSMVDSSTLSRRAHKRATDLCHRCCRR